MNDKKPLLVQCATITEFRAFQEVFSEVQVEKAGKRSFFQAPQGTVVLWGAIGKVFAAASAEFAIAKWQPRLVIDFGAAGALAPQLRVGDMVIADRVIEHDIVSARPLRPLVKTSLKDLAPMYPKFKETALGVRLTSGGVAAGDKDVQTIGERLQLAQEVGAIAATWESSAVGRICQFHEVDFLSVRIVTDLGLQDEFLAEYREHSAKVLVPGVRALIGVLGQI